MKSPEQGAEMGITQSMGFLFKAIKNVPKLLIMTITPLCEYAEDHLIIHLKWVNCRVYEI